MFKRLISIFIGLALTILATLSLQLPEVGLYADPLGPWVFVITGIPLFIGLIISYLISNKNVKGLPIKEKPKPAQLLILYLGAEAISRKVLQPKTTLSFGSGDDDDIIIRLPSVSNNQLVIKVKSNVCQVTNVCCPHGAHVNRQAMEIDKQYDVYAGDTVQMGKIKLIFIEES